MPLYIADYLRDTQHLSALEHGAYMLLIMQYWTAGGLPQDDARLARVTRLTPAEWMVVRPVVAEFFEAGWRHPRIDAELAEAERITAAAKAAGHASARSRRKRGHSPHEPDGNETSTDVATETQRSFNGRGNETPTAGPTETQPITTTTTVDRMGDARAGARTAFTAGSKALASAFWTALGFDDPLKIPPEFAGVDWRAIEWERAGWTPDLIGAEARRLARDGPLKPLTYFEKVFATAFAKRQAPLPVVTVRDAEKITVTRHAGQPGNIIQAADRLVEKLASFDAGSGDTDELRGEAGTPVVRLLSQG
ncbi:DUF1376 domain-containing protein [Bradyrhizobium genosp. L]|uniref:YdaU family protein n=1 Tax=Bradyrhizobium genosp. L TaxID=83637 RepID=UPI0018A274BC|nr:DUF1376 domain-containing protein [Bradyrhizobium genosp. L]QPF81653.1 DUF1376 domain-containing protein [Bradyrhizobium genosp. L]